MYSLEHSNIIITDVDLQRLRPVIDQSDSPASDALDTELSRAIVVDQREVPADVVTMNSQVVYEDTDTGTRRKITLVYPRDANASEGKISVLAPIGSALLGLRVGQTISWKVANGTKHVRVVAIEYQPEANHDYDR